MLVGSNKVTNVVLPVQTVSRLTKSCDMCYELTWSIVCLLIENPSLKRVDTSSHATPVNPRQRRALGDVSNTSHKAQPMKNKQVPEIFDSDFFISKLHFVHH